MHPRVGYDGYPGNFALPLVSIRGMDLPVGRRKTNDLVLVKKETLANGLGEVDTYEAMQITALQEMGHCMLMVP